MSTTDGGFTAGIDDAGALQSKGGKFTNFIANLKAQITERNSHHKNDFENANRNFEVMMLIEDMREWFQNAWETSVLGGLSRKFEDPEAEEEFTA